MRPSLKARGVSARRYRMSAPDFAWGTIHPSALTHAAALLRRAQSTPRAHGALRYQCPVTGSLVLVTDEASLKRLTGKRGRLRCTACREIHLLACEADQAVVAAAGDA